MNLLFTTTARFARRFRKGLIMAGACACVAIALNWATSPPPSLTLEQAQVRNLRDTCAGGMTTPPEDWDLSKERYYVRQRPTGAGRVTVTLWGTYTSGENLTGIVKQVAGHRLLVRPTFERVVYGENELHPACIITFGLQVDFTGLPPGAYSVGIAPTPLERLLD